MDLELTGKRAIVTGASKGIGLRIADHLAREGCDLAIGARGADELAQAEETLARHGHKVWAQRVDIAEGEAYRNWLSQAAAELGGCDIFIPVASGGGGPGDAPWQRNLDIDLFGAVRGVEILLPQLEQVRGAIVFIASTAAVENFFGPQSFNAMKAALINYGNQLSQALASKGVRVNSVSPGSIEFEGGNWGMRKTQQPEIYEKVLSTIPSGRYGTPEEVADVVAFLASARASWVTGANLIVDGGQTKRVQY